MSIELFPSRLKKDKNKKYVICKRCNSEVEFVTADGLCPKCKKEKTLGIEKVLNSYLERLSKYYLSYNENEISIVKANEKLNELELETKWYDENNEKDLNNGLVAITNDICVIKSSLQQAQGQYLIITNKLQELNKTVGTLWNPLNWFEAEQKKRRMKQSEYEREKNLYQKEISSVKEKLKYKELMELNTKNDIMRYRRINKEGLVNEIRNIEEKIRIFKNNKEKLLTQVELYKMLKKAYNINKDYEENIKKLNSEIEILNLIMDSLRNASTPRERYIIHSSCENRFGSGKPLPLIKERKIQVHEIKQHISDLWNVIPTEREINGALKS